MVTSKASPKDIEWKSGKNPISTEGVEVFALYFSQAKKLILSKLDDTVDISLEPFNFELITVSPVTVLARQSVHFAAIGLVNMLNTGGAIRSLDFDEVKDSVRVGVRGSGEMRVFASEKPTTCRVDGRDAAFEYEERMVVIQVPWSSSSDVSIVEYMF